MEFETSMYCVAIINALEHRDVIKNMMTGIIQADCTTLILADDGVELEAGISKMDRP